jgi:hypothetical protein
MFPKSPLGRRDDAATDAKAKNRNLVNGHVIVSFFSKENPAKGELSSVRNYRAFQESDEPHQFRHATTVEIVRSRARIEEIRKKSKRPKSQDSRGFSTKKWAHRNLDKISF